ncbi:hypothetical protein HPB47_024491 [Ixodes persulcatus]|uniref:Uncharacterized protein n=1 Tax=Ixodes persulcatus TaxID=34615 RepID=A0AC60Q4L8_IXOPE|nr:hypothetical protein HPB47_024491 [Ixodes persulcatus]
MILRMDTGSQYQVNLLSALHIFARAWDQVTTATIANCVRHCGFVDAVSEASETGDIADEAGPEEVPAGSELREALGDVPFDENVDVDKHVEVSGPLSDVEIIKVVRPGVVVQGNARRRAPAHDGTPPRGSGGRPKEQTVVLGQSRSA